MINKNKKVLKTPFCFKSDKYRVEHIYKQNFILLILHIIGGKFAKTSTMFTVKINRDDFHLTKALIVVVKSYHSAKQVFFITAVF